MGTVKSVDGERDATDLARLIGLTAPGCPTPATPGTPALSPLLSQPARRVTTVRRAVTAPPPTPLHRPTVVAVFSPKGGVGKTTVSVMLGAAVARRARTVDGQRVRVCLLDLDLFGDVGARLGKVSPTVLDMARASPVVAPVDVERFLVAERTSGLRVLLAPGTPDARNRALLTPGLYRRTVDCLAVNHDVVLLDCGTELTDPVLATYAIPAADRLLLVVNNERATLTAAAKALDVIVSDPIGYPPDRIGVVLNQRADDVGLGDADVLGRLPHVGRIAARLPDDRALFVRSANQCRPIVSSADPAIDGGIRDLVQAAVPDVHLIDLDTPHMIPDEPPTLRGIVRRALGLRGRAADCAPDLSDLLADRPAPFVTGHGGRA